MDWFVYIEHLQFVLKEFDSIAIPTDDLLIPYFQNGLRLFILTQLDKKNRNLNDWQAIVKRVINTKAKVAQQAPLLVRESDLYCPHSNRPLKNEKIKE